MTTDKCLEFFVGIHYKIPVFSCYILNIQLYIKYLKLKFSFFHAKLIATVTQNMRNHLLFDFEINI